MIPEFKAIYARELKYYFNSITAYVTISIFLIISGYFFFSIFRFYNLMSLQIIQKNDFSMNLNLIDGVMRPIFGNLSIIILLILPMITMRLIAEEKKQGTFELLLTFPVSDAAVVGGKYFASLTILAIMLAPTALYPVLLKVYSDPELLPVLSGYLGLFLMGAAFLSIGTFFSSLTSNQLVAGVSTFGVSLFFLVIGWAAPLSGSTLSAVLSELSILVHFESFSKGIIDLKDITYYLLLSLFFLFLTLRSLESSRWRA
ncbi:MAG: ABC transporter permease [Candidatus Krumholzibacteriota bacterium]|nr:ABC transporter permease [Candidatus Krumholzibacteriota bacterium]